MMTMFAMMTMTVTRIVWIIGENVGDDDNDDNDNDDNADDDDNVCNDDNDGHQDSLDNR